MLQVTCSFGANFNNLKNCWCKIFDKYHCVASISNIFPVKLACTSWTNIFAWIENFTKMSLTTWLNVIFPFKFAGPGSIQILLLEPVIDGDDDIMRATYHMYVMFFVGMWKGQGRSMSNKRFLHSCSDPVLVLLMELAILWLEISLREPQFAQILLGDVSIVDSSQKQIIGYCKINEDT